MDVSRSTWTAAVRLGVVMSVIATLVAVASTTIGDVPHVAIVLTVILVAFVASWIRTGQARRPAAAATTATASTPLPIA